MIGVDQHTGKLIYGDAHIKQSIERILFTPLGSFMMQPTFGSRLIDLLSAPSSASNVLQIYVAVAEALATWMKDRINLTKVSLSVSSLGVAIISLKYENLETGQLVQSEIKTEGAV